MPTCATLTFTGHWRWAPNYAGRTYAAPICGEVRALKIGALCFTAFGKRVFSVRECVGEGWYRQALRCWSVLTAAETAKHRASFAGQTGQPKNSTDAFYAALTGGCLSG